MIKVIGKLLKDNRNWQALTLRSDDDWLCKYCDGLPKNCRQVFSNLKDRRATSLGKMGRVQSSSELSLTHSWRGTRHVRSPKTKGTKEDTWKWKIKNHHKITMANIIIVHFFVLFYCLLVIKRALKAHFLPSFLDYWISLICIGMSHIRGKDTH